MKKTYLVYAGIGIALIMGIYFVTFVFGESSHVQKITVSMKNYNYYPNTFTVNVNQLVEITLDGSVGGCYRSFVIEGMGINKYSKTPSDKITFTPLRTGIFQFRCSMGMGRGTMVVR